MNTKGKWLEKPYEAIQVDGCGTFDGRRDYWGELCVFPGLAHLWADRLLPIVREVFSSESHSYCVGSDMYLSCLLYTERYDEIRKPFTLWIYEAITYLGLDRVGLKRPDKKRNLDSSS